MNHDSLEVFDADYYVHVFLHVEVFKVLGMNRDCSFERLLEYFYVESDSISISLAADITFAILYLLREAGEDSLSFRGEKVKLLSLWTEVLDIFSEHSG